MIAMTRCARLGRRTRCAHALGLLLIAGSALAEPAAWVYWAGGGELGRVRVDGSDAEILRRSTSRPTALAVGPDGTLMVGDAGRGTLETVSTTGAERTILSRGRVPVADVITDSATLIEARGAIRRIDPTTGKTTEIVSRAAGGNPCDLAVGHDAVYWSTQGHERLRRARLDGSAVDDEWAWVDSRCASLAFDAAGLLVLEADGSLWRQPLDGDERSRRLTGHADSAHSLVVDGDTIGWVECDERFDGPCRVRVLAANGIVRTVAESDERVHDLAAAGGEITWIAGDTISRRSLAGGPITTEDGDAPAETVGLAAGGGYLFRIDAGRGGDRRLIRSGLDGRGDEILLTDRPLEAVGWFQDRLIWLEVEHRPSSGLFGGSSISTIVSASAEAKTPREIARFGDALREFEVGDPYMVWIRDLDVERQRSDGSAPAEPWIRGDSSALMAMLDGRDRGDEPDHVALAADWIFWSDSHREVILRSRLDGSRRGEVVSDLDSVEGLTATNERLVWINERRIESSHLDGSEQRVVATCKGLPEALAIFDQRVYVAESHEIGDTFGVRLVAVDRTDGSRHVLVEGDAVMGPGFTLSRRQRELISPTVSALAVDAHGLVWAEAASQRLLAAGLDGSHIQVLSDEKHRDVRGLVIADGWLYGADRDRLWRTQRDGSDRRTLDTSHAHDIRSLAARGDDLAWSDFGHGLTRRRLALAESIPLIEPSRRGETTPSAFGDLPRAIAVDGESLYSLPVLGSLVERRGVDGENPEPWTDRLARGMVEDLRFGAGHVVWTDAAGGLWVAPVTDPGNRREIVTDRSIETFILVEDP